MNDHTENTMIANSEGFTQTNRVTKIEALSTTREFIDTTTDAIKNIGSKRATHIAAVTNPTNSWDTASEVAPTKWFPESHTFTNMILDARDEGELIIMQTYRYHVYR